MLPFQGQQSLFNPYVFNPTHNLNHYVLNPTLNPTLNPNPNHYIHPFSNALSNALSNNSLQLAAMMQMNRMMTATTAATHNNIAHTTENTRHTSPSNTEPYKTDKDNNVQQDRRINIIELDGLYIHYRPTNEHQFHIQFQVQEEFKTVELSNLDMMRTEYNRTSGRWKGFVGFTESSKERMMNALELPTKGGVRHNFCGLIVKLTNTVQTLLVTATDVAPSIEPDTNTDVTMHTINLNVLPIVQSNSSNPFKAVNPRKRTFHQMDASNDDTDDPKDDTDDIEDKTDDASKHKKKKASKSTKHRASKSQNKHRSSNKYRTSSQSHKKRKRNKWQLQRLYDNKYVSENESSSESHADEENELHSNDLDNGHNQKSESEASNREASSNDGNNNHAIFSLIKTSEANEMDLDADDNNLLRSE